MYTCVFLEKLKKGTISIKFRYKNFKEPKKLKKKTRDECMKCEMLILFAHKKLNLSITQN